MNDMVSQTPDLCFKVNQIICLEHQHTCLYGEVIQLLPQRRRCWFRPICLVTTNLNNNQALDSRQVINASLSSDLLWPTILFRSALDTEAISFMTELKNLNESLTQKIPIRQHLNEFIQQVWQANQDKF
ncbi:MAG: hypothetical protein ACRC06_15425 [Waterburya sp.]